MHVSRIVILAGTVLGAVALLLPLVSTPLTGSINGIDGFAWPALVLIGIPAVLALGGDRREGFWTPVALFSILLASTAALFAVAKSIDAVGAAQEARSLVGEGSVGAGTWLLLTATIAALTGSVLTLSKRVG